MARPVRNTRVCMPVMLVLLLCPGLRTVSAQDDLIGSRSDSVPTAVAESAEDPFAFDEEEPSVLKSLAWRVGDTLVEAILDFSVIPVRYSAYALERPQRIVIDCFETANAVSLDTVAPPAPVARGELSAQAVEGELQFLRLVLFTTRAIDFRVEETPTRLRLQMQWNTRLERQLEEQRAKRKRIAVYAGLGAVALAGVTVAIIAATGDDDPLPSPGPGPGPTTSDTIPPPDIPLP